MLTLIQKELPVEKYILSSYPKLHKTYCKGMQVASYLSRQKLLHELGGLAEPPPLHFTQQSL
jgi:hypothetical protein